MEWTPPPNGIAMCQGGGVLNHLTEETSVSDPSIIGIDLAKHSFQLHGAAEDGAVLFRKKLSRGRLRDFLASQPRCLVAMEACGSAHYWGRETLSGQRPLELSGALPHRKMLPSSRTPDRPSRRRRTASCRPRDRAWCRNGSSIVVG